VIQRSKEGVVHLMASTVTDRTALLALLNEETPRLPLCPTDEVARGPSHRHPRDVRILPGSRDFH
jgi:error-prone DNA polymerase